MLSLTRKPGEGVVVYDKYTKQEVMRMVIDYNRSSGKTCVIFDAPERYLIVRDENEEN